jgi:hypothetical protein
MEKSSPPVMVSTRDIFQDDRALTPGVVSQLGILLFQPRTFFQRFVPEHRGRRWLWAAILILVVLAFNAVQQSEQASAGESGNIPPMDMPIGPEGMPPDVPSPPENPTPTENSSNPAAIWMTALTTAGAQIIQWLILALVLSEVSMFNGRAPRLGTNLQIAIWVSVPLALMAVIQMVFIAGGGSIGRPGVSGFLESWEFFVGLNVYLRSFIHGLASHLTLFWLWSLALLYIAARQALRGKRPVVIVVIAVWVVLLGIGSGIQSYKTLTANEAQTLPVEFMPDEMPLQEDSVIQDELVPEEEVIKP